MDLVSTLLLELQSYQYAALKTPPLSENTIDNQFPLYPVLAYYQQVGKHFVDKSVLEELSRIKAILDARNDPAYDARLVRAFLDMALDKHLGCYNYDSYTGARLLNDLSIDPALPFDEHVSLCIVHLIVRLCDIALFESMTITGEDQRFPDHLIPYQGRKKRIISALKCIQAYGQLTNLLVLPGEQLAACVDLLSQEQAEGCDVPVHMYQQVCSVLRTIMDSLPETMLTICSLTMQPVWTVHDEHMFIRVLQCFEIVFSIIVKGFLSCQELLPLGEYHSCVSILEKLSTVFQHNPSLFRVLTSMPPESFAVFRLYTEGSSAIQSEQYKLIEALAANLPRARVDSAAYDSVPRIKADYENGNVRNFEDMLEYGEYDRENPDFQAVIQSMLAFEQHFIQWKKMHVNIAVKMVGTQPGTGYTPGSPYLKANVGAQLFPFLHKGEEAPRVTSVSTFLRG